jgi:peptide/nickel transport system permease protein
VLRLIANRLALSIPLVFLVSLLTFVLLSLSPTGVLIAILGPNAPQSAYAALRESLGLNEPLHVRYWDWLSAAVHGDFGNSWVNGQEVTAAMLQRLPVTLALVGGGLLLTSILGVGLGILAAVRRGTSARVVDVVSLVGMAIPSYWLALVLVALFAVRWSLFPATGYVPLTDSPTDWALSLVLPIVVLAVGGVAALAKQTRDGMLDALSSDYIVALRARGVPERSIVLKHAVRNAAIPVVTMIGLYFVGMLSGTVFVETVFALPGLGSLAVQGTLAHDVPVVLGTTVFLGLIVIVVNLAVDLLYGWLNPKARVG